MKIQKQYEDLKCIRKVTEYEFIITPEPQDEVESEGKFSTEPIKIQIEVWVDNFDCNYDNGEDWYIVDKDGKRELITDICDFFADRNLDGDVIEEQLKELIQ